MNTSSNSFNYASLYFPIGIPLLIHLFHSRRQQGETDSSIPNCRMTDPRELQQTNSSSDSFTYASMYFRIGIPLLIHLF